MNAFVEITRTDRGYELCGRIIRDEDLLLIYIDGVGRFEIPAGEVQDILAGLGDGGISGPVPGRARLSESGRGFYLDIGEVSYAIPVSRVLAVMEGRNRKGPVSRVKG